MFIICFCMCSIAFSFFGLVFCVCAVTGVTRFIVSCIVYMSCPNMESLVYHSINEKFVVSLLYAMHFQIAHKTHQAPIVHARFSLYRSQRNDCRAVVAVPGSSCGCWLLKLKFNCIQFGHLLIFNVSCGKLHKF